MADSLESKKHPASELRRRRASEEGVFPRSLEWSVALSWLLGIAILQWTGGYSYSIFSRLISQRLRDVGIEESSSGDWYLRLWDGVFQAFLGVLPFLVGVFCVGLAVHFAQAGFRFRPDRLSWDWGRAAPQLGRWQGVDTLASVVGGLLKLALVAGVVGIGIWSRMAEIISWSDLPLERCIESAWRFLLGLGWQLGFGWLMLAGLDYAWNWWRFEVGLRMTDSELREELKESQGDPSLRSRRRRLISGG